MTNSKRKGDETESKVLHELIAAGHTVSLPFGDNDKYDMIVDAGSDLYRIQCKTAWQHKDSTIRFNTYSQTTRDGEYHEQTYDGDIDVFLVRDPVDEELYWIDIDDAAERKMALRFDAEIDHPSINWADDYAFDGEVP